MTVSDLFRQIEKLVDAEYKATDGTMKAQYVALRSRVLALIGELWTTASVEPRKSSEVGNVVYVSKQEAAKYGRLEKLFTKLAEENQSQLAKDIAAAENLGISAYSTQYQGLSWVYSQGYSIPLVPGVKIRLVSDALFSDFYGSTMQQTLETNWAGFEKRIEGIVTRGLNQGNAYTKIAKQISLATQSMYSESYRVAATEAHRMQMQATQDAYNVMAEAGIAFRKRWIATLDGRTRPDHQQMDGQYADDSGVFHLPDGSTGPEPGMTGVASQDIHCRCTSIAEIDGIEPPDKRRIGKKIIPFADYAEAMPSRTSVKAAKQ